MTLTVEDDFREFVAARWPDLEGVAFLVTLDAESARRVTAQALATLHQHWREAIDEGRPGAAARRSVLGDAIAAAPSRPRTASAAIVPATSATEASGAQHRGRMPGLLTTRGRTPMTTTRCAPPSRRSCGARRRSSGPWSVPASVWRAGPDEVADLLGMPVADVRDRHTALRARLAAAHDGARAAEGLEPADWALDVDLDAAVEHLLAGHGDPPDPTALVEERRRSVRRRSLVAGSAAALAAGAAGWWVLGRERATTVTAGPGAASPSAPPGPDDPSWDSVARWSPRGRLATDPRVQGLVISRSTGGGRLLWADDVAGQRLVVSGATNPGTEDVLVQAWQGAAGADPASLTEVPLQSPFVAGALGVVPLAVPTTPGTLLVVLAAPRVTDAGYSSTVQPTPNGGIRRSWAPLLLTAGIGFAQRADEAGPALRVRCGAFDGPVAGPARDLRRRERHRRPRRVRRGDPPFVAAALGQPVDSVRTEVVTDAKVGGGVIDPIAISAQGGDGRVRVLRTTTADGAVVRSVRVVDDGRSRVNWLDLEPPSVLPADTPLDEPVVLRTSTTARPEVGRFLVIAPGAARVQLLSTSSNAYRGVEGDPHPPRRRRGRRRRQRRRRDRVPPRAARRGRPPDRHRGAPRRPRPARPLARGTGDRAVTVTVEEDFREFVAARWGELESVARLVTLDGPTARRVTTDALADLHGRWGRLLDDGSPGAAARRVVLAGSVAAAGRGPASGSPPATDHGVDLGDGAPDDAAVVALLPVLRGATALERAVLAAASVWGLDPGAVADLLGMPPAPVRDADLAVRRRLLAAHTAARAGAGWEPAEWALERDLDDALDLLAPGAAEPPDAVALVAERHRQVRRRSVVIGAGAALAVGAVASLGVDAVMTGASTQAAPLPPGPGDPVWAMTRDWPARGRLATDAGVLALVASASPRAHLLYADDLAGQRVVVAATADASGAGGTLVRMWTGPRGAAAGTLTSANLVRDRVVFTDDVVPVAIEAGRDDADGAGAVLLLARPTVLEAQVSPVVSYARSGEVGRRWAEVALRDGVATVPLRGPLPPAFRVRLDGYDAGPLGVTSLGLPVPDDPATPLAAGLLDALGPFVAACTGLPESAVRSTVVLDVPVAGDVLAPLGQAPGRGRVVVAHTRVPSGALLRTVRVTGDGRRGVGPLDVETTRPVGPATASAPLAARLPGFGSNVSRFLVIAPGAARAQLVATSTNTYPASRVTALRSGTGVLEVADARRAAAYALITWDRRGRRLDSVDIVFRRRDPRDLWPRVR